MAVQDVVTSKRLKVQREKPGLASLSDARGGVLAGFFDGRSRAAEAEKAGVATLAAIWGCEESVVQKELQQTFSSGPMNLGTSAVGAIVRLREGHHGTVLFLAWSPRLYTRGGDKNV